MALPLGAIDDLAAVEVYVETGGDEPGHVPKGLEGRTRKKVQQFLGTFGSDQVGIDDRDAVGAR
jgi:hypothetical protein